RPDIVPEPASLQTRTAGAALVVFHLFEDLAQPGAQLGALLLQLRDLGLQLQDPADPCQCHALPGELDDVLNGDHLTAGVAGLPAVGARRPDDAKLVEAAKERLLNFEHAPDLPHPVQRQGTLPQPALPPPP